MAEIDEIEQKVIDIVAEQMGVDKAEITRDTSFINDLNADSLDQLTAILKANDLKPVSLDQAMQDAIYAMPDDYAIQVQTALLVTKRAWCDFISYSGGLPMIPIRVYPDDKVQAAIVTAAAAFEARLAEKLEMYRAALETNKRLVPTERRVEQEMHL